MSTIALPAARPARRARVPAVAVALAGCGAASYGVTVVIGRELAQGGMAPATALGVRFAIAAAVLAVLLRLRRAEPVARGRALRILALGAIGYAGQSSLFFLSLQRGTAATSILLFYAYPALVCIIGWLALGELRPARRTALALGLSALGTAAVAATSGPLTVSALGVACALGSALVFALYLLAGQRLAGDGDAMMTAALVAAGAALSCLLQGVVAHDLPTPAHDWDLLITYGVFTAAAFTLTFAALARLGARHTAVVMTLEAVFTVVLAVLLLGESLGPAQIAGGTCVLAATIVVARTRATTS